MGFLDNIRAAKAAADQAYASVPKRARIVRVGHKVGQDVSYHISVGGDHTHYEIDWDKPPQYGRP